MRSPFGFIFLMAALTTSLRAAPEPVTYAPGPGTHAVATWTGVWRDAARNRDVPVKIYAPEDSKGAPFPVIIYSHGLGGTKDGYSYLGQYWAAHGYVSVHIQHLGSDDAVWKGKGLLEELRGMEAAASDPKNLQLRPQDVRFAIDQVITLEKDKSFALAGKMDTDNLAIAGHSFGAYTVMAVAGQGIGPDSGIRYYGPDPRVKCAIAMSSQPAHTRNLDDAYSKITIPIFHMTGTSDKSPFGARNKDAIIGGTTPEGRRVSFDHTQNAPAYLMTFKGGDHSVFSGERMRGDGSLDASLHPLVLEASTAFWDANLKKDAGAQAWLDGGGLKQRLGALGVLEHKVPPAVPAK